jgi:hypothetical protein
MLPIAAGPGLAPRLSKLQTSSSAQRGSAALPCGKPPAFQLVPEPPSSSAQAGRLCRPACAEEVFQDTRPTERRSLSARQAAEPQAVADPIEVNLDKPGARPGQGRRKRRPYSKSRRPSRSSSWTAFATS